MRTVISLFCFMFAFSGHAFELCKAEKGDNYVLEQLKLIQVLDAKGEEKMTPMLLELQKSAGMNEEQLLNYSMGLISKPELSQFSSRRMDYSLKLVTLLSGKDCDEFNRINQELLALAEREWEATLKVIAADIKSYKK